MTEDFKPEGQTPSDNFLVSELKKDFDVPQAQWGEVSDEDMSYLQKKGVKSPQQLLKSYRELERAYSSKISLPKDGDKKALDKLYSHLGMPKDCDAFELVTAEEDKDIGNEFKQVCLNHNILPSSAQAVYDWFVQNRLAYQESENQAFADTSAKELEEVKQNWGADAKRNFELMKRGVRLFAEDDDELVEQIEHAVGTKKMMTVFCKLGQALSEDNSVAFGTSVATDKTEWNAVEYFRDMFNDY